MQEVHWELKPVKEKGRGSGRGQGEQPSASLVGRCGARTACRQSPKSHGGSLEGATWCSVVCFLATSSLEEAGLGVRAEVDREGGHG